MDEFTNLPEILARIKQRLKVVGLSATAASKLAGKNDAIRNIRRAVESGDRNGVSTATLAALAPVLKTTVAWLATAQGPDEVDSGSELLRELTPVELLNLARKHTQSLAEQSDVTQAVNWLDILIEGVRERGVDEELRGLEALRARLHTVLSVARAELLSAHRANSSEDALPKAPRNT